MESAGQWSPDHDPPPARLEQFWKLLQSTEKTAKAMGIPRSQLFALALEEFINRHKKERITEQLNEVYRNVPIDSSAINVDMGIESMSELTQNDAW